MTATMPEGAASRKPAGFPGQGEVLDASALAAFGNGGLRGTASSIAVGHCSHVGSNPGDQPASSG